jgi:FeS assembly protein SufD
MYNQSLLDQLIQNNRIDVNGSAFRKATFKEYEGFEFPSFNRIKVKETEPPKFRAYKNQKVLYHKTEGLTVTDIFSYKGDYFTHFIGKDYGISQAHRSFNQVFNNTGTVIEVEDHVTVEEPIVIQLEGNDENPVILDQHVVLVGDYAKVTLLLDYTDVTLEKDLYSSSSLNIKVGQGALVNVVKVQNVSERAWHGHNTLSVVHREGRVEFSALDFGKGITATDYSAYLEDVSASSNVHSIYLGDGESKLDLGYNTYHKGRRSKSDIMVKGALLDQSRKVFRGNLFFERGASRSEGSEQEYVILLDERVKADSIPALLCNEDDVQGEHAASAGQIDESKLFYLMSRGFNEKEAKQLIIMASFSPVIEKVPIEGLKERITEEVEHRITH